jgi:quinol monooxygenase YgiN
LVDTEKVVVRTRDCSFGVVARLRGLPEKADELRRRLHDLIGLTRHEDGCISCEMIENGCDSTEFTLLEEWSDEEAHNAHFATTLIQNALRFLPILLSRELDLRKHVLRWNAVRYGTNSYCLAVS